MLDSFGAGQPQLVLNLLESRGFREFTTHIKELELAERRAQSAAGVTFDAPPFLTREDEKEAETEIDVLMADVVIPLAARTRAVVICNAIPALCALTASFTRTLATLGPGVPPFTILSVTSNLPDLYRNPNPGALWCKFRAASHAWNAYDKQMIDEWRLGRTSIPTANDQEESRLDLDSHAVNYVIVAGTDDGSGDGPFCKLIGELVRSLAAKMPSLALKTGCSHKSVIGEPHWASLAAAAEMVQSGVPTLFLDVRKRTLAAPAVLQAFGDRELVIEDAKARYKDLSAQLLGAGRANTFDICELAHFHAILMGEGPEPTISEPADEQSPLPLHEAIRRAASAPKIVETVEEGMPVATSKQIVQTCDWLADQHFQDAWELLEAKQV